VAVARKEFPPIIMHRRSLLFGEIAKRKGKKLESNTLVRVGASKEVGNCCCRFFFVASFLSRLLVFFSVILMTISKTEIEET
jgi:hypothetical protein